MDVRRVDPADAAAYDAFYEVYAAAVVHGPVGAHAPLWRSHEVRTSLADPDQRRLRRAWLATAGGRPVATGWVQGSTVDNVDVLDVLVCVAPGERGRGHGRAVLDRLEQEARGLGRTRLLAEVSWAHDDADGARSAELAWARRQGFEVGLVDVQRQLRLPVAAATLDALAAEAAPHHRGYELRSFVGPVPDDLAEGWAALSATLMTEAPTGDIEREVEAVDVAALRAEEALVAQQGRTKVSTVALSPDGEVVAYTDVAVSDHETERAFQWGTLVRADHRGHRLGMAVKVANLRLLQQTAPARIRTLVTFNAEVNAHMVGVNERLGFVPVLRMGELQHRL